METTVVPTGLLTKMVGLIENIKSNSDSLVAQGLEKTESYYVTRTDRGWADPVLDEIRERGYGSEYETEDDGDYAEEQAWLNAPMGDIPAEPSCADKGCTDCIPDATFRAGLELGSAYANAYEMAYEAVTHENPAWVSAGLTAHVAAHEAGLLAMQLINP